MLACLTAKDVPMERIVPAKYLPPSEDAGEHRRTTKGTPLRRLANMFLPLVELQRAFREVEIAFRYPSADSDFRGLPKAIADLGSATGLLHGGEAILHSFCSGVSSKFEGSRLRKDLSIQHMSVAVFVIGRLSSELTYIRKAGLARPRLSDGTWGALCILGGPIRPVTCS